ncbi:aspartate aminotransferase family protein [Prauserella flavalba]|uniref:Class III aminotransferase n=1 Tax=Prauserella flavalba TaxID=1477506 RepID=A0A318LPP5_9PSEU|nr:aminotransferase class III-fold pyridoxal phosphate-dependent enzyme [Prauserella flavalba]PXY21537.1 class III aminotransferase [Prauserella flavalba]
MSQSADDLLFARATAAMPGGNTRSTVFVPPHPPYAVTGRGCVVTDANGHEVYDCNNNYTSLLHGHAHPEIVRAAREAVGQGSAFGLPTESEIDLAELLRERTGIPRWRFCNSGTEAVMMAVRAARAATGRGRVIRFHGSYHGTYDGVVGADAAGVPQAVAEQSILLPQDDPVAFEHAMATHGHETAAVLLDLMPNRAGLRPVSRAMAELVRKRTAEHGALLIIDEVITFRLGNSGLRERYDVEPDLTTVGKVIGGGFPVGAVGGTAEVMDSFNPLGGATVSWGGTFSANPVSMRAGLTALRLFDAGAVKRLNALGDQLRDELATAGLAVNGTGSLVRLLVDDYPRAWWDLYRAGVLVGTNGLIALSTAMTDDDVIEIGRVVRSVAPAR